MATLVGDSLGANALSPPKHASLGLAGVSQSDRPAKAAATRAKVLAHKLGKAFSNFPFDGVRRFDKVSVRNLFFPDTPE